MPGVHELCYLPCELGVGRARSALDVKSTGCFEKPSDDRDLGEVVTRCDSRKLESKTGVREAEK